MNQGYLIYASGQAYIQQAVLCAMSILVHNPKAAISLVTDTAITCLLYTSPSPRDRTRSRMPSSA